jgi:hypothetical protein
LLPNLTIGVARTGHLIALKVLSRDDVTRPQDLVDLRALLGVASPAELTRATHSLELIAARGYHRGRDLMSEMNSLVNWASRPDRAAVALLVAQLQARQSEREQLLASIAATEARQGVNINRRAVEQHVHAWVAEWRTLLTTRVAEGRQVQREVLRGPIRFTPDESGRQYRFEGPLDVGRLLSGAVEVAPYGTSPTGSDLTWKAVIAGEARRPTDGSMRAEKSVQRAF